MAVTVTGPTTGLASTGNPNSTAFATYDLDDNQQPIEASGCFLFNGQSYAVGYTFAIAFLSYCQLTNQ